MRALVCFFDGRQDIGLCFLAVQGRTRGLPVEMLDVIRSQFGLVVASWAVVSGCVGVVHNYMIYDDTFKWFQVSY